MAWVTNFLVGILKSVVQFFFMRKVTGRFNGLAPPMTMEKINGIEYLLGAAGSQIELPEVRAFREMLITQEVTPSPDRSGLRVEEPPVSPPREELSERMLAALAVITIAAQSAARRGDIEGMKEVLHIGFKSALEFERL